MLAALARNWWMVAIRGGLAVLLGLAILLLPRVGLGELVVLFGSYALLDGLWAVASALRVSPWALAAWPVALEGLAGIALGVLAFVYPWLPRELVHLIAAWGLITGVLEIIAALRLPRDTAGHWLLLTGGASSIFLALFLIALPRAVRDYLVNAIALYALLFGVIVSLAAYGFRRALEDVVDGPGRERRGHAARPARL